ncbi:MAG: hypothetical protein LUE24_12560 [Lachnospiraceae bacterium]|nr:hypothetical protein [Lachnospiraceae bacterium]
MDKKKLELLMSVVLILCACALAGQGWQRVSQMQVEVRVENPVVVVDAGHGGSQLRGIRRKAAAVPKRLVKSLKKCG